MKWIGDKIGIFFAGILIALDTVVYWFISGAYRIFISLAGAELLTDDAYELIAQKIYIVIGVAMLFVLAYAILKGIIDPDKMTKDGAGGSKMVQSVVVAVLGLALVPVFFNLLYQAQSIIINHNLIGNIFSGISITDEDTKNTSPVSETITDGENSFTVNIDSVNKDDQLNKMGGAMVSTTIWSAFFHPSYPDENNNYDANKVRAGKTNMFLNLAGGGACGVAAAALIPIGFPVSLLAAGAAASFCYTQVDNIQQAASVMSNRNISLAEAYTMTSSGENFSVYSAFINNVGDQVDECKEGEVSQCGSVEYSFFVSTMVGVFVLYCFISFSIDMGKRAGMLAFYQIMAPVPLIMQIIPKYKDSLKKYIQAVISCFLNVFVCIFVVYMVVYLAGHVTEMFTDAALFPSLGAGWKAVALVCLIVGLIIFAKSVPKMISETFGIKEGSLKLGIGEKLKQGEAYTAWGIGSSIARSATQQAQEGWSRRTNPVNGNQYTTGQRVANAINGGVRGAFSGGFRAGQKRFKDHKPFDSYAAAAEVSRTTAEAINNATQERVKNQKDIYSRTNKDGSARSQTEAFFKGHLENATNKVKKWGTATVDTSYDDTTISTYGTMADNRDALRGKTGKVEQTRFVENLVNNLKQETVTKFDEAGYNAAIEAATRSVIRAAGETDDHYYGRIKAAQDAVDRSKFENKNFVEDSEKLQRRTNAMSKLLESIQDLDYMGLAAIKDDAAAKDALQAQITAQIKNLGDRANEKVKWKLKVDSNGNPDPYGTEQEVELTVKELMQREYGVDVKTGQINWETLKNNTRTRSAIEIVDGSGNKHQLKATFGADGTISGFEDRDGFFGQGVGATLNLSDIAKFANDPSFNIQNISALSSINNATDAFKTTRQTLAGSAEYLSAKARQREQNNKK